MPSGPPLTGEVVPGRPDANMPDDDNGLGILLVIGVSLVVQFGLHHWQRLRPRSYHLGSYTTREFVPGDT